jgi:primosomal protein N' (replication factor Y)
VGAHAGTGKEQRLVIAAAKHRRDERVRTKVPESYGLSATRRTMEESLASGHDATLAAHAPPRNVLHVMRSDRQRSGLQVMTEMASTFAGPLRIEATRLPTMDLYATAVPVPAIPGIDELTYRVPDAERARELVGYRVLVPLGRRRVTAIVTSTCETPPPDIVCKDLLSVIDEEPTFTPELLALARWIASYYAATFGETLALAVPRALTTASRRMVTLREGAMAHGSVEAAILAQLRAEGGRCDATRLARVLEKRGLAAPLARLAERGAVSIEEAVDAPSIRPRTQRHVEVVARPSDEELAGLFGRAHKRRQIFEYLLGAPERRVPITDLAEMFPSPQAQVTELEKLGLVRKVEVEVYRGVHADVESASPPVLTEDQRSATEAILASLGRFEVNLLQGVTSSGKTEIYLRVIGEVLERGGSALVLVPEISLTHQTIARLMGRFGPTVAVLHSELRAGERWDEWRRLRRGEARIAVGARSAVLAPLDALRLIVVDEEHDGAYKQDDGVRYHGRDVAVMRAQRAGCPIVLGSATPSIESWHHATTGRYRHLLLPERVTASPLPAVEVVDLRGRDIHATGGLSDRLRELLQENHDEGGQTLLFLNRRGYAAQVQCYECGEIEECDDCSVGMTYHRAEQLIRCHHCDRSRRLPERCTSCGKDSLLTQGLGTQRLEQTILELLPDARVERLDRDSVRRRGHTREVLSEWRNGVIDVLIGTQMITKGHDVAGVTLVGVVQADLGLGVPDFRSAERTFQVLTQVAGRAGRGERRGRVVVQTYKPDHFAVAAAARHDYEAFATTELAERKELEYPPFSRMALIRVEGRAFAEAEALAQAIGRSLRDLARKADGLVVRGPAPSPIERIKTRHRFQLQLRAKDGRLVRHAATGVRAAFRDAARAEDVRLLVDIDPVDML